MVSNFRYLKVISGSLILLLVLQSCSTFKKAAIPAEEIKATRPTDTSSSALLGLEHLSRSINILNAKANVEIVFQGNDQDVKSQIRWIRDSVLWMNFSLIGIEGARLKITRDSFFMVDRINKRYMAEPLAKMADKYDLPITFNNFQAILLGYPVILSKSEITEERKKEFNHFVQQDSSWRADYYTNTQSLDLSKMNLRQKKSNHVLTHQLNEYKKLQGSVNFAFSRIIEFYSKQTGQAKLSITLKDITINTPKEIKFSIPSSYEKM